MLAYTSKRLPSADSDPEDSMDTESEPSVYEGNPRQKHCRFIDGRRWDAVAGEARDHMLELA